MIGTIGIDCNKIERVSLKLFCTTKSIHEKLRMGGWSSHIYVLLRAYIRHTWKLRLRKSKGFSNLINLVLLAPE